MSGIQKRNGYLWQELSYSFMTEESGGSDDEIRQHRLPWRSDSTLICTLRSVHSMLRYTMCMSTSYVQTHTSSSLCHEIFRKIMAIIFCLLQEQQTNEEGRQPIQEGLPQEG